MKSTVILHVAREPLTGVWTVIKSLVRAQRHLGLDARLGLFLTPDWPHFSELEALGIPHFISSSPTGPGTIAFLRHWLIGPSIDTWVKGVLSSPDTHSLVVHHHNAWMSGCLCGDYEPRGRLRTVVTFHGVGDQSLRKRRIRLALHRLMATKVEKSGAKLVSVDGRSPSIAASLFGFDPNAFAIIPNGVECEEQLVRRPSATGALRVLFAATLTRSKGWHIVAAAADLLNKQRVPIVVTFCGRGPDEGDVSAWCAKRQSWAHYLGYVSHLREEVLPDQDVICLPSSIEGLPMILLESMGAGLAAVATRVGGIPELISDGVNGLLINRSVEDAARALERLSEASFLQQISVAAHETICRLYNIDTMTNAYVREYTTR